MRTDIQNRKTSSPPSSLSLKAYEDLKKHVASLFLEGKKRAQEAVEREKIRTYWEIGRSIHQHVLENGRRADYGKQVIQRLSGDLKTNETLLYYALQFAREYESLPANDKLSWSHYRALLPVKDREARAAWETRAEEWGWSSRVLENAISEAKERTSSSGEEPELKPGDLYTYRVLRRDASLLWLDLGFSCSHAVEVNDEAKFFAGDVVQSRAEGKRWRIVRAQAANPRDLFHYQAEFRGIDSDGSLLMDLDLGFRFRLVLPMKINGLELGGKPGEKAREISEEILDSARGEISVRTLRSAKTYRYAGDIFVSGKPLAAAVARKIRRDMTAKRDHNDLRG